MFKKRYLVANWKQNKNLYEAISWCRDFVNLFSNDWLKYLNIIICPSYVFLHKVYEHLSPLGVFIGAQDISTFKDGSHTGFVGTYQIKDFVSFCLVGHSERNEDTNMVREKVLLCLESGITPIVCFKDESSYFKIKGCLYALEDPRNISHGGVYRPKDTLDVVKIVEDAKEFFGDDQILIYGGSVNIENVRELANIKDLGGLLVGQASLSAKSFCLLAESFIYEISRLEEQ